MIKTISKKIIKTKLLILLSLFSVKPAVASNYHASSKTKITIKTAKSKGYKKSSNQEGAETISVNTLPEDELHITGDNSSTSSSQGGFKIKKVEDPKKTKPYEIAVFNE